MEKFNKILKNVLIFLIFFLIISQIMGSCQNKEDDLMLNSGNVLFTTTDTEYSRRQSVIVQIKNSTKENLVIENQCPDEPFQVFRYENNDWVQKTAEPEISCENAEDIILEPGKETKISYTNWNNALFSEMGRFRIEFDTEIGGEQTTLTTNEFIIVKEGIFKQLWYGLFYRPIYNTLIYIAYALPGHSLGLAIIILTLIIRTILLIPSQKAMKAQKRMQEIQPRLEKIKEKYKGDQQKIAQETMALWKEAKASPLNSCLPILLQFPFLIAIFYVAKDGLNPDNTYLLYKAYEGFSITDINVHFLGLLDLTRPNIYVLPIIVGGLQFIQMKLSLARQDKKNNKNEMAMASNMMIYFMPVMIAMFTASMPAGVGIYWGTSTFYGIIQQIVINRGKDDKKENSDGVKVKVIEPKNNN